MPSRYDNRKTAINNSEMYKKQFENRGVKFVRQYKTANISYPTLQERSFLDSPTRVWTVGDRFYKLADQYYGDSTYWWIIAWYNQAPTESHIRVGDVIEIPLPFDRAMSIYARRSR